MYMYKHYDDGRGNFSKWAWQVMFCSTTAGRIVRHGFRTRGGARGVAGRSDHSDGPVRSKLHRSFGLLGVGEDASVDRIREAYITLARKLHPDAGMPDASAEKFSELRDAYMRCVTYAKNIEVTQEICAVLEEEMQEMEEELGFRKRRNLPHRHYLTHDVGPGTYSQRERFSTQLRLDQALDSVFERKMQKALENSVDKEVGPYTGKDDPWLKASQGSWITHTVERIVDDKIREAMSKGDFTKLEGAGKPLKEDTTTASIDSTTRRLNKMLIDSDCTPQWINLEKEIRQHIKALSTDVSAGWYQCGPFPMARETGVQWEQLMERYRERATDINLKITRFNLIVPAIHMQKASVNLDLLVWRVALETDPKERDGLVVSDRDALSDCHDEMDHIGMLVHKMNVFVRHSFHYIINKFLN